MPRPRFPPTIHGRRSPIMARRSPINARWWAINGRRQHASGRGSSASRRRCVAPVPSIAARPRHPFPPTA